MENSNETKSEAPVLIGERELDRHDLINTSGHVQELDRQFSLQSICAMSIAIDNAWGAGGGALVVALYNGGGPGVLYGLVAATVFYCFIGASLAELASAMPTSGGVYHWASITAGPRYGRVCSWYAGWWNCLSWIFGVCSGMLFAASTIMGIYTLWHPDFEPQRWHVFLVYLGFCVLTSCLMLFGQSILSKIGTIAGFLCLLCVSGTILTCAIMPSTTGYGYASNGFVWTDWTNLTGYSSQGFVFVMGMLNGAFAVGTPDGICHLCEETRKISDLPKAIFTQLSTGFVTTFLFYVAILYSITSLDDVFDSKISSLPLAAVYQQATRSKVGTTILLIVFLIDIGITVPTGFLTANRCIWSLARDDATPFSAWLSQIHPYWRNPFNAQLVCSSIVIIIGCIYIGSQQAFNAFIGIFTIFTTMSYLAAFLPHILTRRKYVVPGRFWMPGIWGYVVPGIASAYVVIWSVIFMFPFSMPVSVGTMNWNSVIAGGFTILITLLYLWKRNHGYVGPRVTFGGNDKIMKGVDKAMLERRLNREE